MLLGFDLLLLLWVFLLIWVVCLFVLRGLGLLVGWVVGFSLGSYGLWLLCGVVGCLLGGWRVGLVAVLVDVLWF